MFSMNQNFDMSKVVLDDNRAPLVCYGCGHSAGGKPYPSFPSGERPCAFCVRNPNQRSQLIAILEKVDPDKPYTARYDNGPTQKRVGDQYIATDRITRDLRY
jgi:hypothetical protein